MYIKTINEFIADADKVGSDLRGGVVDLLSRETNCKNTSEMDSWGSSLPILANVLKKLPDSIKDKCEVVLEAGFNSDERADVVLVGKDANRPVVIIIENKQWSQLENYEPASELCLTDPYHANQYVEHPCYQVAHYKYLLDNTNKYVIDNDVLVISVVFMHNATETERRNKYGPFDQRFDQVITNIPIFVGVNATNNSDGEDLKAFIEANINDGERGLARNIYGSSRKESRLYKETIGNLFGDRQKLLELLDENQISIFDEIRQCVYSNDVEKSVFIIEGDPGTGKTFVAEALIAYLYRTFDNSNNFNIKLVLKNKDPRRALQRQGMPTAAVTYGLKNDHSSYDCLICDESHRMLQKVWGGEDDRSNIDVIVEQSRVAVFFYDSRQRVHVNDYVTDERIIGSALAHGVSEERIIRRKLEYQHRCLASDHFMQLIDRILYEPERGLSGIDAFHYNERYKVALIDNPRELMYLIQYLNGKVDVGTRGSRVLAGKGRTNGVDWEWKNDSEPIERRRTLGPFRNDENNKYAWNLHEYPYPESFASDDSSVNLVGCIDTSQGLDFSYIGLFFAPDVVFDAENNCVRINLDGHQVRDPDLDIRNHQNEDEILKAIIRNTYRVLASRGARGCFIYCCDEGLQRFLGTLVPTCPISVPDYYKTY